MTVSFITDGDKERIFSIGIFKYNGEKDLMCSNCYWKRASWANWYLKLAIKVWKFFLSGGLYKNKNFQSNLIMLSFIVFLFYQDNTSLVWGAIQTFKQEFLQEVHRLDQKVIARAIHNSSWNTQSASLVTVRETKEKATNIR